MKLSKEELKKKIDEKIENDDVKIELLEDIEDSFEPENNGELEEMTRKYEEIKEKYKARFLEGSEVEQKEKEEKEDEEEKEVIDVKEI